MKEKAIQVRCSGAFKDRIIEATKHYNMSISNYIVMLINENLKQLGK